MLFFIKNLFSSKKRYSLGSIPSIPDVRNIHLASFQAPSALPAEYETYMTAVRNQGQKPSCVACATCEIGELYLKRKGIDMDLSDDDLYEQCKKIDGIPNTPGTYPTIGAKIACTVGIASVSAYDTKDASLIEKSRTENRFGGYAFVNNDYQSICQAIYTNGAITVSVSVDENWFSGIIGKVLKEIGRHDIVLHGFRMPQNTLLGQNSWGIQWIGHVAGLLNPSIKPGHFEMYYQDVKDTIGDLIAFADIPKKVLDDAKNTRYIFLRDLKIGMSGADVTELQKRLKEYGYFSYPSYTNYFGTVTQQALIKYQISKGIISTGYFGPMTRDAMNKEKETMEHISKLDLWCEAIKDHEGWYEGSRSYVNNNPGNLRYAGQMLAIKADNKNFCVFPTYQDGYMALRNMLVNACTGKSQIYNPEMSLIDFYNKYAPSSDNNDPNAYAEAVAKAMGVDPSIQIKNLV